MHIKNLLNTLDPYQAKLEKAEHKNVGEARKKGNDARASGDRVSLSDTARMRTEAYSGALAAPDIRREKVTELKQKVEAGTYEINSQDIARKLLQDEVDFFS